jgi:hypothetical protein
MLLVSGSLVMESRSCLQLLCFISQTRVNSLRNLSEEREATEKVFLWRNPERGKGFSKNKNQVCPAWSWRSESCALLPGSSQERGVNCREIDWLFPVSAFLLCEDKE